MPDKIEVPLSILLMEIKGTEIRERVDLYVRRWNPKANGIDDFMVAGGLSVKEGAMMVEALTQILLAKDYSRLPELPRASLEAQISDGNDVTESDVRRIVREELAKVMETIAKVLKE